MSVLRRTLPALLAALLAGACATPGGEGAPVRDADGDGLPDDADACPGEAEVVNGFEDEDGCPDSVPVAARDDDDATPPPMPSPGASPTPRPMPSPTPRPMPTSMPTSESTSGSTSSPNPVPDKVKASKGSKTGGSSTTPDTSTGSAAEARLPPFDWPPPKPTFLERLPLEGLERVADVRNAVRLGMELCDYPAPGWYSAPGGFVAASPLERLNDDGSITTEARWEDAPPPRSPLSFAFWTELVQPKRGRYRVVLVALTVQVEAATAPATAGEAEGWRSSGAAELPRELIVKPVTDRHEAALYVYEFYRRNAEAPTQPLAGSAALGTQGTATLKACMERAFARD